jgi:hypothetical protein
MGAEADMSIELVEIEPNRFVVARKRGQVARSALPAPMVISDEMPPTEQVDGKFYTSKAAFRAVGRAAGLIEVGNEKPKPKVRSTAQREVKLARQRTLKTAVEKFKAGHRADVRRR